MSRVLTRAVHASPGPTTITATSRTSSKAASPRSAAAVSVTAGTNTYSDNNAGNGTHEYRVGAQRHDGRDRLVGGSSSPSRAARPARAWEPPSSTGWTPLVQSADSRVIYVSSSEERRQQHRAQRRCAAAHHRREAYAKVRHNFPDWVLLSRGDVFDETLGFLRKNGRSTLEPMVFGTYGTNPASGP